jgi:hypothetical protein
VYRLSSDQEYAGRIKPPQQKYDEGRKGPVNGAEFYDLDNIEGKNMLRSFEENTGNERTGHGIPPAYFSLWHDDVEGRNGNEDEDEGHDIFNDKGCNCPYLKAGKIVFQCIEDRYSGRCTEGQKQENNEERNKKKRYEEMADE